MHRRMDRRTVAKGAAAMGILPAAAEATGASTQSIPDAIEPSLYERLGGIFAIAAVVDRFSDAIVTNPKLNENPALKAWNELDAISRLPGLKFGRTIWIAAVAGGPYEYTGLPLNDAHTKFHLTSEEFDEVGRRSCARSTITRCRNGKRRNSWTRMF